MKKSFLLLLLMTLLPLASWAVDVTVGDYTVTLDKTQYVAWSSEGVTAPTITAITKGETPTDVEWSLTGVYTKSGNPIEIITAPGEYYLSASLTNDAKVITVPFYVGYAIENLERVNNKDLFDASVASETGVYHAYYGVYQYCDVWFQWGENEADGYILYPGEYPDVEGVAPEDFGKTKTGDAYTNYTVEEANQWYGWLFEQGFEEVGTFKRSWYATGVEPGVNPDNFGFTYTGEQGGNIVALTDGSNIDFLEDANGKIETSENGGFFLFAASNFPATTWDLTKFQVMLVPATVDLTATVTDAEGPWEIQVTPQSGVVFPWKSDFDLSDPSVNPDLVITCTSTVLNYDVNLVPGLKAAVIKKLEVNEAADLSTKDPGVYTYSLGLKDDADKMVTVGGVVYLIAPVSDGQVVIGKAKNEFKKDDEGNVLYPVLKTGLTYTAAEQDLIANAGEAAFNKIEYAVVSKTTDDTTVPEAPTTGWGAEAKKIDAGEYYVWARPAADEAGFWAEGDPVLLKEEVVEGATADPNDFATIAKATPTIVGPITLTPAGVGENNRYFLNKYTTENPLTITPSGAKVQFNGKDVEGATITYVTWNPADAQGASTNFTYTATGDYKIQARFVAEGDLEKNFNNVLSQAEPVEVTFQVADRPAVTVTVSEPAIIGQGTNPVFDYTTEWEDGAYTDGEKGNIKNGTSATATSTATYRWYTNEQCTQNVRNDEFTNGTPTATGTYYVQIDQRQHRAYLRSATHDVVLGAPLKVQVVAGDIEAEIADYTGDDALIYGQPLPLTLKHRSGLAENDVEAFEEHEYIRGQFTAKLIKDAKGDAVEDGEEYELTRWSVTVPRVGQRDLYTALPVGTYKVSANITSRTDDNRPDNGGTTTGFNVFVADATWEVVPKDITNIDLDEDAELYVRGLGSEFGGDVAFSLEKEYIGEAIVPSAADMNVSERDFWGKANYRYSKMVYGTDYEITVPETEDNVNAGEVTFAITGKGNFKGSVNNMKFTIAKAEMKVKPAAGQSWTVGESEEYKLDEDYMKAQLKGKDKADGTDPLNVLTAPGFDKLAVKRICSTTIGNHAGGLKAYKTDEDAEDEVFAQNYYFTFEDANADLAINPGIINLKVKDVTVTYKGKDAEPAITHEFELAEGSTLSELLAANWKLLVKGLDSEAITWSTDDKPENGYVADTYEDFFGCSVPEGTLTADNYNVTVTDNQGDLIINPAEIALKAADQGPMALEAVENGGFNASPVLGDNATVVVTGEIFDPITDIVESIEKPTTVKAGENTITLKTKTNDNYTYPTPETGILYVGAGEGEEVVLALTSNMDDYEETSEIKATVTTKKAGDWSKLTAYEGVKVDKITLQLKPASLTESDKFSTWNEDEWHAMVLPFEISVKELSQAFDYAYVNVVDAAATTEKNVQFRLANILDVIPANTPFCIKTSVPYQYATADKEAQTIEFRPKGRKFTIDLTGVDENWLVEGVDAGMGYKFSGTYKETFDIDNTLSYLRFLNNKWYFIKSTSDKVYSMPPYTGFVNLTEANASRDITFTFEEADGSTTAIKAIDFFSGNNANVEGWFSVSGMKMNGAPTQKGTYIQNGKKVLVK